MWYNKNRGELMKVVRLNGLYGKEKTWRIVSYVLSVAVALACIGVVIYHVANGDPNSRVSSCIGTALAVFVPYIIEIVFSIRLGNSTLIVFSLFLFMSSFWGSAVGIYKVSDVYDKICHTMFGYLGCYLGLLISSKMVDKKSHPWHALIISFLFIMACASVWEIWEFLGDTWLGGTAQSAKINGITPVTDTMLDIIVTFVGGLVFLIQYSLHIFLKKDLFVDSFLNDNDTKIRDYKIEKEEKSALK